MNILKKSIAPITDHAWKEITQQADSLFNIYMTARKFSEIEGPTGLDQGGIPTGRLLVPGNQTNEGINYGVREVLPFIEIRKPFELNVWELDNAERGAKDINLDPLIKAAKEVAQFEDSAAYKGFKAGGITGLEKSTTRKKVVLPIDSNEFLKSIGSQIIQLQKDGVNGPYNLIINDNRWQQILDLTEGYPVYKELKELIQGEIIINHSSSDTYLVSARGDDFEFTFGQDISIGYDSHTTEKVKLYFTESFTFRVLSPEAITVFSNS